MVGLYEYNLYIAVQLTCDVLSSDSLQSGAEMAGRN